MSQKIHPTAIIDSKAELADGVEVGPYAVIEADVVTGPHDLVVVVIENLSNLITRYRCFCSVGYSVIANHTFLSGQ